MFTHMRPEMCDARYVTATKNVTCNIQATLKNPAISHGRGTGIQIDEQLIKIAGNELLLQGLSTVEVNIQQSNRQMKRCNPLNK